MAIAAAGATRSHSDLREFRIPLWAHAGLLLGSVFVVVLHIRAVPISAQHWGLFQNMVDVLVYGAGGVRVREGVPLYDGNVLTDLPFTYPPFAAVLFTGVAWIASFGKTILIAAWSAATIGALWLTIVLSWRALGYRVSWQLLVVSTYLAVILTWLEPVRTTIWYGQINLILMALLIWDLTRRHGSALRGWSVGITAGIKLTPGFFFVYLALTKQWRAFVTGAVAFVATVAVGFLVIPRDALTFWQGTMLQSERVGEINSPANQSITGALAHLLRVPEPPLAAVGAATVVVLLLGLTAIWLAHRAGHQLLALTLTGLTACMVSPFSWGHHWVWFVPLLIILCDYAVRVQHRAVAARLAWLLPIALYLVAACWIQEFIDERQPTGVFYAIGTFMLLPPQPGLVTLVRVAYPLVYLIIVIIVVAVFLTGALRKRSRAKHGDGDLNQPAAAAEPARSHNPPAPDKLHITRERAEISAWH